MTTADAIVFATLADGSVMNEDIALSYTQTGHTKEEKGPNWERGYTYNAAERLSKVQKHYNCQRDYNPYTGRYLQPDPIGLNGGLNLYRYAYNSPLMYMDPEGEWAWLLPAIGWGVVNGALSVVGAYLEDPCASPGEIAAAAFGGFVSGAVTGGFMGAAWVMRAAKVVQAPRIVAFGRGVAESVAADMTGLFAADLVRHHQEGESSATLTKKELLKFGAHAFSAGVSAERDRAFNNRAIDWNTRARDANESMLRMQRTYESMHGSPRTKIDLPLHKVSKSLKRSYAFNNAVNLVLNPSLDLFVARINRDCSCPSPSVKQ